MTVKKRALGCYICVFGCAGRKKECRCEDFTVGKVWWDFEGMNVIAPAKYSSLMIKDEFILKLQKIVGKVALNYDG